MKRILGDIVLWLGAVVILPFAMLGLGLICAVRVFLNPTPEN